MPLKLLDDIISEHFASYESAEIALLFNKYNIFESITKTIEHLKFQIQKAIETDNKAPVTAIATSSSNLLVLVNTQLIKVSNQEEKRRIQTTVGQIGIRLLLSIVKVFPEQAIEIFEHVKQTLQHTSGVFNYDFNDINKLMNLDEFEGLILTLTGVKQANEIQEIDTRKKKNLIWTKRVNIGILTTELKRRKWIKSQNEFAKLFENPTENLKVRWDMSYKYELAYLLFKLKDRDFIRPRKGFFSIIEKYVVDLNGTFISKNSLKKMSSKITTDQSKYTETIKTVEEIIQSLLK